MIRKMFNLRCKAGHHHYSPDPKAWAGRTCMTALSADAKGKKCPEPMAVITPANG